MTDATAVLLASAISALVAMVVVGLQNALERRRQERQDHVKRLAAFFSASHAVALGIGSIAFAAEPDKAETETRIRSLLSDRINTLISELRLREDPEIIVAIAHIADELTRLTEIARSRQWNEPEWHLQHEDLACVTKEFEAVARAALGFPPLRSVPQLYSWPPSSDTRKGSVS